MTNGTGENEHSLEKTLERAINFLYIATVIASIVINIFDIFRLIGISEMHILYTNIPAIFIILVSLLLKNIRLINLKQSFSIVVFTILVNSIFGIFQSRNFDDIVVSLMREAIFISFLISLSAFVVSRELAYTVTTVFCLAILGLYAVTKDSYILENLPLLILVFVSYTIFINYLVAVLYRFLDQLLLKNRLIKGQMEEIKAQNEELSQLNEELHTQRESLEEKNVLLNAKNTELTESKEELNKLVQAKNKLFSVIGHDIKNPLHVIMGYSKLLNMRFDTLENTKKKSFIDIIDNSVNKLYKLLEDLLIWAKSQQDKDMYSPQNIDLNNIITKCIEVFEGSIKSKGLHIDFSTEASLVAYADENMVYFVMRNIIDNAIKYSHQGGMVKIIGKKDIKYTTLLFIDNGIGIPQEMLNDIFEMKTAKSRPGPSGEKGSGFGLAICKGYMDCNKGEITAYSEPGVETRFTVKLPRIRIA
jgi:signal transduction histidine kinase